jgi:hypothetical protein
MRKCCEFSGRIFCANSHLNKAPNCTIRPMNTQDLSTKIDYLNPSGVSLTIEEKAALHTSLLLLKRNTKLQHVRFWGKIYGINRDYLIGQGCEESFFQKKKNFCRYSRESTTEFNSVLVLTELSGFNFRKQTQKFNNCVVKLPKDLPETLQLSLR